MKRPSIARMFPLLGKELIEEAARKRTYVVRMLFAIGLFVVFWFALHEQMRRLRWNPWALLGQGKQLFEVIVALLFTGIYVFLPALMASAISHEKERSSLDLLLLTDLRPHEIVFQKFAGRLIPFLTMLLLSLPVLAVAYTFGGIASQRVWAAAYLLFLTCLQVGAIALMCSAFCGNTVSAFVSTYAVGGVFFLLLPLICVMSHELGVFRWGRYWDEEVVFAFLGPYIYFERSRSYWQMFGRSIPIVLSTAVFFGAARFFLQRRSAVKSGNVLLSVWKFFDRFVSWGVVLVGDGGDLPRTDPITWRETNKKALGKVRYLIRLSLLALIPAGFVWVIGFTNGWRNWHSFNEGAAFVYFVTWIIVALTILVQCGTTIPFERSRGTLDVLLTAPMSGRSIVAQKMGGTRRLLYVLLIGLGAIMAIEMYVRAVCGYQRIQTGWWRYTVGTLVCLVIYPRMLGWFAMWIGLRSKTSARAIINVVSLTVVWCAVPVFLFLLLVVFGDADDDDIAFLLISSPAANLVFAEIDEWPWDRGAALVTIVINAVWHGIVLLWMRSRCLKYADKYLGRIPSTEREGKTG